jgi:hypothetical protein
VQQGSVLLDVKTAILYQTTRNIYPYVGIATVKFAVVLIRNPKQTEWATSATTVVKIWLGGN